MPRPPLAPPESGLNAELTYLVFLEMADERAVITGETGRDRRCGRPSFLGSAS